MGKQKIKEDVNGLFNTEQIVNKYRGLGYEYDILEIIRDSIANGGNRK